MSRAFQAMRLRRFLWAWLAALPLACGPLAFANPGGESVRHGNVSFERSPGQLRIHQSSQRAVIDWRSFSIDSGETTRFLQPDSNSAALNRVRGSSASVIEGALRANGQVYLINPNGILIGPRGTIDVGGFVASTLDVSDRDFLAGGDLRFAGNSAAAVVNLGAISAFDGDVVLIASSVTNAGTIRAPRGTAALAAGSEVLLAESGEERVFVRGQSSGGVTNTGTVEANIAELKAHGGNVYGMAVKNEGRVAATGVTRQGGQIFLSAKGGKVRSTGTLQARRSDGSGGRIAVDSGAEGRTEIGGTVDASGAGGAGGAGGEIVILGNRIEVFDGALILNDGESAGGTTRIGGGLRGQESAFANSEEVSIGQGARITATARGSGEGGRVIVFAEGTVHFRGTVSVAGAGGGRGGFVELSGQRAVFIENLSRQVDLGAATGPAGTLLLDPIDISVVSGANDGVVAGTTIRDGSIVHFLENTGNLVITTSSGTGGSGDITLGNGVGIEWSTPHSLAFEADRDFFMTPGTRIEATGDGSFSATARDLVIDGATVEIGGSGDLSLYADRALLVQNALLSVQQGDLFLYGNIGESYHPGAFTGVTVIDSKIESHGPGTIEIRGRGGSGGTPDFTYPGFSNPGAYGVRLAGGTRIVSHDTASDELGISIVAHGGWTGSGSHGLVVDAGGATIETAGRSILLRGSGGGDYYQPGGSRGIHLMGAEVLAGDGGRLDVEGFGTYSYGSGGNEGVYLGDGTSLETEGGDLRIEGTAGDENSDGILGAGATLSSGGGLLFLHGTGGWGGGAAIRFTSTGGRIGEAADEVKLLSAAGDVLVDAQVRADSLRLIHLASTPSHAFVLDNPLNDVNLLATGEGTGAPGNYGVLGSLWFREASGFSLGSTGVFAAGDIRLVSGGALTIDAPLASSLGNIELEGLDLLVEAPVSAAGDLEIRFGSAAPATSGTADIRTELVAGGLTTFSGNDGDADTLRFDQYAGPTLVLAFDDLDRIEHLVGPGRADDLLLGPAAASTYLFDGSNSFRVGGTAVFGFPNLDGGANDNRFQFGSGASLSGRLDGGGGRNTLDYAAFGTPVTVNLSARQFAGAGAATGLGGGFFNFQDFIGSAGPGDLFAGPSSGSTYEITANHTFSGPGFTASGFERLLGGSGNDTFNFRNQATLDFVDGGAGNNLLTIDDSTLRGKHTYTVSANGVDRPPSYRFANIENLRLLLGPGDNTVNSGFYHFNQYLVGGRGFNTLNLPGVPSLEVGSPIQNVHFSGFSAPLPSDDDGRIDQGDLLQNPINRNPFPNQPGGGGGFDPINLFNTGLASNLQQQFAGLGGAFPAAALGAIAGQALVIVAEDGSYLVLRAFALDGSGLRPSNFALEQLAAHLGIAAHLELAAALGLEGAFLLLPPDGAWALDLSGPPGDPVEIAALLESLGLEAARELYEALALPIVLVLVAESGAMAIALDGVPVPEALLQRLAELLAEEALGELNAALGG